MHEIEGGAWFHTREGEQTGPVSYADLLAKAKEARLHPQLDFVWTRGMAAWKPSGEIEGLFESAPSPDQEKTKLLLHPNPQRDAPTTVWSGPEPEEIPQKWPGVGRRYYVSVAYLLPLFFTAAAGLVSPFLIGRFGEEMTRQIVTGASVLLAVLWIGTCAARIANLGMSRWWTLGYLVPFLNVWLGYRSFAAPAGYASHRKLDGAGIFLAIIYWLVILSTVLAAIGVLALSLGAIRDPEMQQQLHELLHHLPQP